MVKFLVFGISVHRGHSSLILRFQIEFASESRGRSICSFEDKACAAKHDLVDDQLVFPAVIVKACKLKPKHLIVFLARTGYHCADSQLYLVPKGTRGGFGSGISSQEVFDYLGRRRELHAPSRLKNTQLSAPAD